MVLRGAEAWRPLVLAIAASVLLVAGAVHLLVVPLDVLVVWRKPAPLVVTSEPEGALVRLDGAPLGAPTPTETMVHRDRYDHVLECRGPGYRSLRRIVRYDGAVTLAVSARLDKASTPTLEALPSAKGSRRRLRPSPGEPRRRPGSPRPGRPQRPK